LSPWLTAFERIRVLGGGVKIPGHLTEARVSLYADDTTIIALNGESVVIATGEFTVYERASGACVNLVKCCYAPVAGFSDTSSFPPNIRRVECIKINGVYFGEGARAANVAALRSKLSIGIAVQAQRPLTTAGRAIIANIMLLSKLWYVGAVAPLTLKFVDSAMSDIAKFVWRSKEWLNRLTAIGQPIKGGLGLYSIRDRLEAYYVRHLADFLWGPPAKWQGLASYFIALVMRRWNPDVWNNHTPHSDSPTLPPFYATALAGFKRYVNTVATVDDPSTTVKIVYAKFVEQKFLPPPESKVCRRQSTLGQHGVH
jgi:hypothetical protein